MSNKTQTAGKLSGDRQQPVCHVGAQNILTWQMSPSISSKPIIFTNDIKCLFDSLVTVPLPVGVPFLQGPPLHPAGGKHGVVLAPLHIV